LKDHILLEGIYKTIAPDEVSLKTPLDFVKEEEKELFEKYDGKPINEIEDEGHKKAITEAIQKARVAELEVFANKEKGKEIDLSEEQVGVVKDFFEKDRRPFPREYHAAIIGLHEKLFGKEEKKEEKSEEKGKK
jgi:6-pyruvoyl-tetrahydropterin synthase